MNPRHLELADEFCKLVGNAHLMEYLGLEPRVSAEEARSKLKKRRKYMQGMQSNPKYKNEALFLIKNFAALDAVLNDPTGYLDAVGRQQESEHLPILEMTIRGVLKGGQLTEDQEVYLRRNALELGLSERTFEDTLTRLAAQAGIARPGQEEDLEEIEVEEEPELTDHYGVLGVRPSASRDEIYDAYRARYREVRNLADRSKADRLYQAIDRAWQVLSDAGARDTYDLSLRQTGPPARDRQEDERSEDDRLAPTAPPVRQRAHRPGSSPQPDERAVEAPPPVPRHGGPASSLPPQPVPVQGLSAGTLTADRRIPRLEVVGSPVRVVQLAKEARSTEIRIRNPGQSPGRITSDEPWLLVSPTRLDPEQREQTITVRIDPRDLPAKKSTGVVTVQSDRGDRASIVFEVKRRAARLPFLLAGVAALALGLGVLIVQQLGLLQPSVRALTIAVDPTSEAVLLDGEPVGSGALVLVPRPPEGRVTLTVLQPNFETWIRELDLAEVAGQRLEVRLAQEAELDFVPAPDLVQAKLDETALQQAMAPRTRAMDACVRQGLAPGDSREGHVRIHLGPEGRAIGVELEGEGTTVPAVRDCLRRQAAAVSTPALESGDYATVRYDYSVTGATL